jgi:hypothetical protein
LVLVRLPCASQVISPLYASSFACSEPPLVIHVCNKHWSKWPPLIIASGMSQGRGKLQLALAGQARGAELRSAELEHTQASDAAEISPEHKAAIQAKWARRAREVSARQTGAASSACVRDATAGQQHSRAAAVATASLPGVLRVMLLELWRSHPQLLIDSTLSASYDLHASCIRMHLASSLLVYPSSCIVISLCLAQAAACMYVCEM